MKLKVKRDIQAGNKCLRIKEWVVSEAREMVTLLKKI